MTEVNSTAPRRPHPNFRNDLTGQRFGKWLVTERDYSRKRLVWWKCRCDCGKESIVNSSNLQQGKSRSCGCDRLTQNNLSTTREYAIWSKMLLRCYGEKNDNYRYYGGRGVYVCRRWRESFLDFREDMGLAPSAEHTLDRIESTGHYTCGHCEECEANGQPANCRWATKDIQVRNQRSNRYYEHDGKRMILKDWARESGIKYLTLWNRLKQGVPFDVAISAGRYDRKLISRSKRS